MICVIICLPIRDGIILTVSEFKKIQTENSITIDFLMRGKQHWLGSYIIHRIHALKAKFNYF